MLKNYNNTYVSIPLILHRQRSFLLRKFPELIKYRRKYDPIHILEAIFYLLRSGCQWRLLPINYPHWKSVYNKWRYWNAKGIFKRIHSCLIEIARRKAGRKRELTITVDLLAITRESVRMPPIWPSQLRYTVCCELSNIASKCSLMWSAFNAVDSIGVSYTYAGGKHLVVRNSLLYGREVTLVRIFLAYFETHIGYNARIAPAVTFKICSKISASTTPKI